MLEDAINKMNLKTPLSTYKELPARPIKKTAITSLSRPGEIRHVAKPLSTYLKKEQSSDEELDRSMVS